MSLNKVTEHGCREIPRGEQKNKNTGCAEACPQECKHWAGRGFAFHTVAGGLRTSSLPGELPEAVYTEAVAALSLDRLP